ncbi:hypothetical protein [Hydrogenobaculum acidophilum]
MLVKGIYLDKSVILQKTKGSFEIKEKQENSDYVIKVLPPKDALIILNQDAANIESSMEILGYKILTKDKVDFETEDIWVFALLRALDTMQYDNLYVVFKDDTSYILCQISDKKLTYYEVFFNKEELITKLNTIEGDILFDTEDINTKNLKILPMLYIKKGELLAFGGALKKIQDKFYNNDIVSTKKIKKELINIGVLSFSIFLSYMIFDFSINHQINMVKQKEEEVFEKAFPNTPIVDIKEQTKALIVPKDNFKVSKLLLKAYENLPPDAKVYELFYKSNVNQNNILVVKSEVNTPEVNSLKNITFSRALPSNLEEITQTWALER